MLVDRHFRQAVHPQHQRMSEISAPVRPIQVAPLPDNSQRERANCCRKFKALVQLHEPDKAYQVEELLRTYAGMENELLQCYRHYYTGKGGFRIPTTTKTTTTATTTTVNPSLVDQVTQVSTTGSQHNSATFSLPKTAIATYLREKLRMRSRTITRSNVSNNNPRNNNSFNNIGSCAKGDDMRSPEMPIRIPATSTHYQQPRYVAVHTQPHLC